MARSASETLFSKFSEHGLEPGRVPSWHSFGYQPSYAF